VRILAIRGIIDRRILANYHIDPDVLAGVLPPPFRPKIVNGHGIGGICLIRLKDVRPGFVPLPWGMRSENAVHRITVEWAGADGANEGVYIPRRDTDSRLSTLAGGTILSGIQHHARFSVEESAQRFLVALKSDDGDTRVHVSGTISDRLPSGSVFSSVAEASAFFEGGALGYSATEADGRFDGLELVGKSWSVDPLELDRIESSFFEDESRFPAGSVEFDCALLMRGIEHEWHGREDLCCGEQAS